VNTLSPLSFTSPFPHGDLKIQPRERLKIQKDPLRPLFTFHFKFFKFISSSSLQRTVAMVWEKEGAKKRREEVHSHRGAVPGDFGEGGNTVNISGKRLRRRSA
jgi:hypothetical protein